MEKDYTAYSQTELISMVTDLEAKLRVSENDCGILAAEVQRLKGAANSETQTVIDSLKAAVAKKDAIIEDQKKKLDESSTVVAKKDEIIANKDKAIDGLIRQSLVTDEKLRYLEAALRSANEEADSKREAVKKLEAAAAEKDKIIKSLRADAGKAMHPVKTGNAQGNPPQESVLRQVDPQGNAQGNPPQDSDFRQVDPQGNLLQGDAPQGSAFRQANEGDLIGRMVLTMEPVEEVMKRRQPLSDIDNPALDHFMGVVHNRQGN